MSERDIDEWVEDKLDEYDEEELKEVLEDEGFDPSIVDEALENSDSGRIVSSPGILEEIEGKGKNLYLEALKHRKPLFAGIFLVAAGFLGVAASFSGVDIPQTGQKDQCPDVGIQIMDVYASNSSTTVDTKIYRGSSDLTVEIQRDNTIIDSVTKRVSDRTNFTVDSVGSEAVLHPAGCEIYRDSVSYAKTESS